ncbi:MAG: aldehyde dehydrogenase family protein [Candidatus Auribacterota bacterium]|nr:aldehyde dehydrogenase family protein [Candidatus Auribacterota bacterium]
MTIDEKQIRSIVQSVVKRLTDEGAVQTTTGDSAQSSISAQDGIFDNLEDAISAAESAQKELIGMTLEKRGEIIEAMRQAGRDNAEKMSRMAVEETGMGRFDSKIQKHLLVSNKTPGIEDLQPLAYTGDHGLSLVEMAPYGLIGAIIPSTNPTSSVICNAIGMVAAGNSVVFGPHPGAKSCSQTMIQILNQAITGAGGPADLLVAVREPTIEIAQKMMHHPRVRLLLVTGGPGVVKAAMQTEKKVIAAGPGNPPVVVDETADIAQAGRLIVAGASFDNNIVCVCEKEIFAVRAIADDLKRELIKNGAFEINKQQIEELTRVVVAKLPGPDGEEGAPNKAFVGRSPKVILKEIGVEVGDDVKIVLAEVDAHHPLVLVEQLMPVIPFVRVDNVDQAIDLAVEVEHGFRHSMYMYSHNVEKMSKMARACNSSVFVKNGPCYSGLGFGGQGYTSFSIASPTGEGLTKASDFTRERRCVLIDYFHIV